jgi:hypothetical protein
MHLTLALDEGEWLTLPLGKELVWTWQWRTYQESNQDRSSNSQVILLTELLRVIYYEIVQIIG